jgi:replicative DNA helicase
MSKPNYVTAADALAGYRDDLLSGRKPTLYPVGDDGPLAGIEIGPGLMTLLGGPPGHGKTALAMQWTADALRLTADLRAIVCNVEMPPAVLIERQLARLSGIPLDDIRHRRLNAAHSERLDIGLRTFESFADRLAFLQPPFNLKALAAATDQFDAGLLVIDYLQRVETGSGTATTDRRGAVGEMMSNLREIALAGYSVLAVAAVGRGRDSQGRSAYDGLGLASFRESSELEYGADDAYLLVPDPDGQGGKGGDLLLRHVKCRYGAATDIPLQFDGRHQQFTAETTERPDDGLRAKLADLWNRTATPGADDE